MSSTHKVGLACLLLILAIPTEGHCKAVELPIGQLVTWSQVIARVQIVEILSGNPKGDFCHTARAKVILPFKGVVQGQTITLDYDTGLLCPNVLYARGEDCLVFLYRERNGRLTTLNDHYGKYLVQGDIVRGWVVKRFTHRDVPLKQAIAHIRRLLAARLTKEERLANDAHLRAVRALDRERAAGSRRASWR